MSFAIPSSAPAKRNFIGSPNLPYRPNSANSRRRIEADFTVSEVMPSHLEASLAALPTSARILDAGGWFLPLNRATHVVDLMPYETRRGRLSLERSDDERFSNKTWFQADFCSPTLRLPFDEKYFDFCTCTQTLEDLANPAPLLGELRRIARPG